MTLASRVLMVLAILFVSTSTASAADPHWAGLGAGIGMGLAIVGAGIGLGLVGFSALSSIARQPEQAKDIKNTMLLLAALIEGAAIIALLLGFAVAARFVG